MLDLIQDRFDNSAIPKVPLDGSAFDVLHSEVLEGIYRLLLQEDKHGVALIFSEDLNEPSVEDISAYVFDTSTRQKNLGFHVDAFDRPESRGQILTGLYSPVGSGSSIPTWTTLTREIDDRARTLIESEQVAGKYEDQLEDFKRRAAENLPEGEKSFAYYTLLQNCFLAHRDINRATENSLIKLRDDLTRGVLNDSCIPKGSFVTNAGENSLLLFRNGLGENREIAHTRFNLGRHSNSQGNVYNLSIRQEGVIHANTDTRLPIPNGINVISRGITNRDRVTIIPR